MTAELAPAWSGPGEWVKAALHTHTTVSDGTLSPRHVAMAYADAGFDVLAVTDHWRLADVPPTGDLVMVPAAELGFDLTRPRRPRQSGEFLVYGVTDLPEDPGGDRDNWMVNEQEGWEVRTFPSLSAGTAWAAQQGAVVYVAHPYWNGLHPDDLVEAEGFAGIEVFNGSAEIENGRGDSSPWWDALLGAGRTVHGIATDDQHYPLVELGLAWTMLRVRERSVDAVLSALRDGHAYGSEGPIIHEILLDDGAVEVACSPARAVRLQREQEYGDVVAAGRGGRRMGRVLGADGGGLLTRVRFPASAEGGVYRRVVVVDAYGRRAWSNLV